MNKFLYLLVFGCSFLASTVIQADIAVIVHPSNNDTGSNIDKIFLGKIKNFESGAQIVPFYLESGAVREEFDSKVLSKSGSQVKAYWSKLMFTGKGSPPEELATESEVLERVSKDPGAIDYISAENVTNAVKVLATFK